MLQKWCCRTYVGFSFNVFILFNNVTIKIFCQIVALLSIETNINRQKLDKLFSMWLMNLWLSQPSNQYFFKKTYNTFLTNAMLETCSNHQDTTTMLETVLFSLSHFVWFVKWIALSCWTNPAFLNGIFILVSSCNHLSQDIFSRLQS